MSFCCTRPVSMRGYWQCCACNREVNERTWGSHCPDCSHLKCGSCKAVEWSLSGQPSHGEVAGQRIWLAEFQSYTMEDTCLDCFTKICDMPGFRHRGLFALGSSLWVLLVIPVPMSRIRMPLGVVSFAVTISALRSTWLAGPSFSFAFASAVWKSSNLDNYVLMVKASWRLCRQTYLYFMYPAPRNGFLHDWI